MEDLMQELIDCVTLFTNLWLIKWVVCEIRYIFSKKKKEGI